jgi:hypothetical protein
MIARRFFRKHCNRFRRRFVACAVLGLYAFALVAMPALHGNVHDYLTEPCCESSDCDHPVPEETCPLCEFVRAAVPFCIFAETYPLQMDIIFNLSFTDSKPSVADGTILPPCRAPPVHS